METTNRGYIYLLQLTNEKGSKVYKIGKAEDIESRLKGYKFKKILFSILINDYEEKERYLISLIKNKYSIASGREFFYANEEEEFPPEEPEEFEIAEEATEEVVADGEGENSPEALAALPAPEEAAAAELAQGDAAATDSENTAQGSSELDELQAAAEAMAAERLASENPTAKPEPVPTA